MKLTFLGTSAGENYPALWCRCPHCEYARTHKGRNLRRHSCALLDDDVMLDMPSHAITTAEQLGLDLTGIRTLLVTHDHSDHFDPLNIICRVRPAARGAWYHPPAVFDPSAMDRWVGPRFTPLPRLDVFGHESVWKAMNGLNIHIGGYGDQGKTDGEDDPLATTFHALTPGKTVSLPDRGLRFTPVVSRHGLPGHVYNYVIERGGKTILYACDCGGYDPDMYDVLMRFRYDCVVFEGTFGLMKEEQPDHMNLQKTFG